MLDRRKLLAALGASTLAAAAGGILHAVPRRKFFQRTGLPIGLQLYTLGAEAGRDIDATFAEVARIGYREIELPSLLGRTPAELGAASKRAGLKIVSLHLPLLMADGPMGLSLASAPEKVAEALRALGATWAVAPILMLPDNFSMAKGESFGVAIARSAAAGGADIWKRTAEQLNRRASALQPLGINVGYHNHNLELAPIGNTTGWDILWRETQTGLVSFEIDLGWVATAGLDPVRFLDKARGRVRLLHVKDVAAGNQQSYQISMKPAEVGSGTLDWARILPAAHRAGTQHFLVEQEPPFAIPRIESAARSYAFLSELSA